MDKFEFDTDSISYNSVEEKILNYYNLGYPQSSNFNELRVGVHSGYYIQGETADITFTAIVARKSNGGYSVTINPEKIS